jgi:hypothetical protein
MTGMAADIKELPVLVGDTGANARAHAHTQQDLHALAETLTRIERKIDQIAGGQGVLRNELGQLVARIDALETEFGPLARAFTGRRAVAAAMTRRRAGG